MEVSVPFPLNGRFQGPASPAKHFLLSDEEEHGLICPSPALFSIFLLRNREGNLSLFRRPFLFPPPVSPPPICRFATVSLEDLMVS